MKTNLGIRIVSLVLALELALSPVAMARAASPAQDLQPETPLGEEATAAVSEETVSRKAVPAASSGGVAGSEVLSYGVSTNVDSQWHMSVDDEEFSIYWFSLKNTLGRLNVELPHNTASGYSLWMTNSWKKLGTGYDDTTSYLFLPDQASTGRVPDMEFEGYYLGDRVVGEDGKETVLTKEEAGALDINWDDQNLPYYIEQIDGEIYRLDSTYDNTKITIDAQWKASSNAQVTALAIDAHAAEDGSDRVTSVTEVYTQDPLENAEPGTMKLSTLDDDGLLPTTVGDAEDVELTEKEMWLWVGKDQTTLDLHFQTYEPFIDYTRDKNEDPEYANGENCLVKEYADPPVQVSYAFDGGEAVSYDLVKGENLECFYTPKATQDESYEYTAQNDPENPARGQWTVKDIPLTETREDGGSSETETVTLTVTAPDGENTRTYTLHIQRRQAPTGSMAYGNTPAGMIQRCDDGYWGSAGKATKEEALAAFKNIKDFQDTTTRPGGSQNQLGQIYLGTYYAAAWSQYGDEDANVDLDDTAVVAYLDSAFEDPGVSFTDSVGRPVTFGSGQGTVTRTIQLTRPADDASLGVNYYTTTVGTEPCYYSYEDGKGVLSAGKVSQTLQTGTDLVDLRGLHALPGVYTMEYTYQDALTSATDGVDGAPDYTVTLTRTLVLLPIPGDVDMDGAVTVADAVALRENLTDWNANTTSTLLRLMKYRVFNLNGDNVVDEKDVEEILSGYQPAAQNGDHSDYFYLPLPGEEQLSRKTWDEVTPATGKRTLSLKFLGVEQGTRSGEYTQNPGGPWDTKTYLDEDGYSRQTPVALPNSETGEDDSVFWMGVELSGIFPDGSEEFVEEFSFSLIYDSTYVEPASIYTAAEKKEVVDLSGSDAFNGWLFTMRKYNLRETDGIGTIWTGKNNYYTIDASDSARAFQTHYSKVISQLEEAQPTGQASSLKELVFTMEHNAGTTDHATWQNGLILVVPFRLKVHPQGTTNDLARLIEIGPGMRDFTLVTSHTSAVASFFGITRSNNMETTTAAFSAQDEIFGGSTQNLRAEIQNAIQEDATDGMVPIGADNTTRKALADGTYGEPYKDAISTGASGQDLSALPPGLTYTPATGLITGTPTVPGDYQFTLNNIPYSIHISQKTLRYRPVNAITYYGEAEYRGDWDDECRAEYDENRDFTFEYNAKDLSDGDREWLSENVEGVTFLGGNDEDDPDDWRPGSELEALLSREIPTGEGTYTYTPPAFAAFTDTAYEEVVTRRAPASGRYTIHVQRDPASTAYTMEEAETASLRIYARPVYIHHVVVPDAGISIFTDDPISFQDLDIEENDENHIYLTLADGASDMPLTGEAKIDGDQLAATITQGAFQYSSQDANNSFVLQSREETRPLAITSIKLRSAEGFASGNYTLQDNAVHSPDDNVIYGTVKMKLIKTMTIASAPSYFARTNTYGDRMEVLDGLRVAITQDGDTVATAYDYDGTLPTELNVHYNWVTPEEYEAGIAAPNSYAGSGYDPESGDARPYETYEDRWLYPYMDGWRICACVLQDGDTYIKAYTDPISIQKKELTIIPSSVSRYYGETLTGEDLTYTFSVSDLASRDRKSSYTSGTPEVLAEVLKDDETFQGFTMTSTDSKGNPIDKTASVTGSPYQARISGGESSRYAFRYAQMGLDENGAEKALAYSATEGWAPLYVKARPLVVQNLRGNNDDGTFDDIYADTKNLVTSGLVADLDHVTFAAPPTTNNGSDYLYYTETSNGQTYKDAGVYDGDPVVKGDELSVTYQITFLPDEGCFSWTGMTKNFFESAQFEGSETGVVTKPVQAHMLTLTGSAKDNYKLVYADATSVAYRAPSDAVNDQRQAPKFNGPGEIDRSVVTYLVSGVGRVHLRPIEELVLTDLGQMTYTYGDEFAPGQPGAEAGSKCFTVQVYYADDYDKPADKDVNVTYEEVHFDFTTAETGSDGYRNTTFSERGFTIYYAKPGQSREDAVAAGQILHAGDIMTPAEHHGASLFITGRRSEKDPMIYAVPDIEKTLVVSKAHLTLYAQDGHKIYGEPNPTFTYTFRASELADVDKKALAAEGLLPSSVGSAYVGTQALLQALDPEGYAALQPTFTTTATEESPIYDPESKERAYPVAMSLKGELSNYTVDAQGCNLYIYPRPVSVTGIVSSVDYPVYTVYTDTAQQVFKTNLTTNSADGRYVTVGCGSATVTYATTLVDGSMADLPITLSKGGLVNGDALTFAVSVEYPVNWQDLLEDGATDVDQVSGVLAYVTGVLSSDVAQNYTLNYLGGQYSAVGAAKLRTIVAIHIKGRPQKMDYTYQESLDLTGLQVQVDFARLHEQEIAESKTVDYIGEDHFQSYGLYVNYWGADDELPENLKDLPAQYRVARTGDHLTIAPTHDTQGLLDGGDTARNSRQFAANGKYLIISAFQAGEDQAAAAPVVLGAYQDDTHYYEGTPIPITVKPLRLRFDLSATDKTYDGDTATAGSLELTNLFQRSGAVDEYNLDGVTDVVYVPVGAPYEGQGDDHHASAYDALKAMVSSGHVTFTTGFYTPNEEAPLLKNGFVTWTYDGYTWGEDLTFSFANANVHYVDDSGVSGVGSSEKAAYWRATQAANTVTGRWDTFPDVTSMPVEVTHILLRGPDAANYTWGESGTEISETQVTMETRAQAVDGQAAAPFATIHKANRALIQDSASEYPTVQVDIHTNVVRLFFRDALLDEIAAGWNNNNVNAGQSDVFQADELHFEYALAYLDENGLYRQWAGRNGDQDYQDTTFFGGETVAPAATAQGYLPELKDLPQIEDADEETIYKGQLYPEQWLLADTGVSSKGFREDSGFQVNSDAYPGGADYRDAYWFYELYTTDRKSLPRNTVFYPLVRLAETHNYNASGDLTGTGETSVSAAALDAARKAVAALGDDPTAADEALLADARAKSAAVFAQGQAMTDAAKADAQAKVDYDRDLGDTRKFPDVPPEANWPANVAVKTFTQRLDILSTEETRGADDPSTRYMVETLEAVWFTDTLVYEKVDYLNAVVYNDPTRYYNFYWDKDRSAMLKFNEGALNFTEEIVDILIKERQSDNTTVEKYITVNQYDETVGGHVAKLYAQVEPDDDRKLRSIRILPQTLFARLGDPAYQLQLVTDPEKPSDRRYTWTSSDPAVATVDSAGLVTFRGVGTATITVTAAGGRHDSITVTVLPALPALTYEESLFDHYLAEIPWMKLDYQDAFRPHDVMTRTQMVLLLDQFLLPGASWQAVAELPYQDVTGEEAYADALRRLTGAGVVVGLPGSTFAGDQPITRAEMAAMLARMLRLDVPDTKGMTHIFQDSAEEDTWAYAYIDAMGKSGIMRGVGDGNFAPSKVVTREEAAAVIARLLTVQLPDDRKDLKTPSDMTPENWSYESVLRAINAVIFPD